jgi:hypothetical protein
MIGTLQERNRDWFPRMQAMSLAEDDADSEQPEMRAMQEQLRVQTSTIKDLVKALEEVKQVRSQCVGSSRCHAGRLKIKV